MGSVVCALSALHIARSLITIIIDLNKMILQAGYKCMVGQMWARWVWHIWSTVRTTDCHSDKAKCRWMVAKTVEVSCTEKMEVLEGRIADIQDSYKYLGISQASENHDAWRSATAKYLQNVRLAVRNHLNCRNKIQAINEYSNSYGSWDSRNNKLATRGDRCHWCQDTITPPEV